MTVTPNEARKRMVDKQLRARGLSDERVLRVMGEIPREQFVPSDSASQAYDDRALPIDCGQTISQPYIVGLMTSMLTLRDDHRVLEVGTGTGYQTAILSRLAGRVFTTERIGELLESARKRLSALGVENVEFLETDGSEGWAERAPFDRIIVTAAAPEVPDALVAQLCEGGRMVLPVGPVGNQVLTLVERRSGRVVERPGIGVRFVKLLGSQGYCEGVE